MDVVDIVNEKNMIVGLHKLLLIFLGDGKEKYYDNK